MPRKSTAFRPTLDGLEQRTALSGGGNVVVKITEGPITNSTLCVDLMAEYWRVLGASLSGVPPLAPSDPQTIYEHLQDLQRVGLLEGVALDSPDVPPATLYERTMDAMVMSYRRLIGEGDGPTTDDFGVPLPSAWERFTHLFVEITSANRPVILPP
jgi:hypothetical protein